MQLFPSKEKRGREREKRFLVSKGMEEPRRKEKREYSQLCVIVISINSVVQFNCAHRRTVNAARASNQLPLWLCRAHVALARTLFRPRSDAWPHYHNASIRDHRGERETRVDL